jgi:heptosyltransferase-2
MPRRFGSWYAGELTCMSTVPHGLTGGNRLVIVAPNWLGDAVMALPAVADVRRATVGGMLAIAARPAVAELFRMAAAADEVVDASHDAIANGHFDAALLLTNSFKSAWTVQRAGIRERWGYRADARRFLLTRSVSRPAGVHQVAFYQHLVGALGFPNGAATPHLTVNESTRGAGAKVLTDAGWDGIAPLVAFAPGAANGRAKRWPADLFARAITAIARERATPVLIGTASDQRDVTEMRAALDPDVRVLDLVGRTTLPELAGVLVHCRGLVTNDSGGMHLGAALGVPVTAMFGPSNERETHPTGPGRSTVLTNPVWCRPCMLRECPIDHRCMRGISVDAVVSSARAML